MRAYFWGNMYLSSIQQGIQSLHCLSEMYIKYSSPDIVKEVGALGGDLSKTYACFDMLYDWAANHKTVVVLNAGEKSALLKIVELVKDERNPYAFAWWSESDDSLNGCLTNVGIILPERMYKGAQEMKKYWRSWDNRRNLNEWEIELAELINKTYMAR